MIATTERVGRVNVSFGLPSPEALFLNQAYKAFVAYRDVKVPTELFDWHPPPQGIWPENHKPLFDFFEHFTAHIVFAHTALESFANEAIPSDYTYQTVENKTGQQRSYNRDEIQRHVSLNEKLSQVLPTALKVHSPKGSHLWRDYNNLKRIRDRIIHLKSTDMSRTGPATRTLWGDMLRNPKEPFCDNVHALIGQFGPAIMNRRWYQEYPYTGD
jgi:hypothetical protein